MAAVHGEHGRVLPELNPLVIPGTGACNHSMASNYNHVGRPPVVAVRDGTARLLLRRETESDMLRRDIGL